MRIGPGNYDCDRAGFYGGVHLNDLPDTEAGVPLAEEHHQLRRRLAASCRASRQKHSRLRNRARQCGST